MRNVQLIPLNEENSLVIASDNSGGIGIKGDDHVQVPYETVSYYSFRVAAMECIAAGGELVSVVLQNFCGNEAWEELVKGVKQGLSELGLSDVSITGSTESNFPLIQSALGTVVVGKQTVNQKLEIPNFGQVNLAVIGLPLVGNEVVEQEKQLVPLSVFLEVSKLNDVICWPVGSKGVFHELQQLFPNLELTEEMVESEVNIFKSSGPATCFIAAYQDQHTERLFNLAGNYMHSLKIKW
ncbi:ATP-binding protein [Neobacillus mesonae]|uniref:ATP-binding protein n=1 Tax=Neobacillus mesonae TaxID=1193713 RepID=UPI0025739792|nr:ATP-binding protein [Neobacillus mesonae]MED4205118.1 ATP-binding protein [Neobacillus mesonae]